MNNKLAVLAADDELTIVLVEPELADMPNSVIVHWPPAPTVSDPGAFPELASGVVKLFAAAATKLGPHQIPEAAVMRPRPPRLPPAFCCCGRQSRRDWRINPPCALRPLDARDALSTLDA